VPDGIDARILIDIDLSILGAPASRFDEYERQVRAEYGWVPGVMFRRTRRKILESFAARPRLYSTAPFVERCEAQARENLARSIAVLGR
jgi:predicted metal-dependent HD superfamily phosphohydrolase